MGTPIWTLPGSMRRTAAVSNPLCPCLADLSAYGLTGDLIANVNGKAYNYGPGYGTGACAAHDENTEPFCHLDAAPGWCVEHWCYIAPSNCAANISIEVSSYFAIQYDGGLYYSTDACGHGADNFSTWFARAGDIGDECSVSSECFGSQAICNPDFKCGCRSSFKTTGVDCTELTPSSSWALAATCVTLIFYTLALVYLLRVTAEVTRLNKRGMHVAVSDRRMHAAGWGVSDPPRRDACMHVYVHACMYTCMWACMCM